jgi:DNA-binding LytR/AlgR family response regulator
MMHVNFCNYSGYCQELETCEAISSFRRRCNKTRKELTGSFQLLHKLEVPPEVFVGIHSLRKKSKNNSPISLKSMEANNNSIISLSGPEGIWIMDVSSIVRIEADSRYIRIFLPDNTDSLKAFYSLDKIESLLKGLGDFYRCHRSHLINIKYVKRYQPKNQKIETQIGEVPIARSRVRQFKDTYCSTINC